MSRHSLVAAMLRLDLVVAKLHHAEVGQILRVPEQGMAGAQLLPHGAAACAGVCVAPASEHGPDAAGTDTKTFATLQACAALAGCELVAVHGPGGASVYRITRGGQVLDVVGLAALRRALCQVGAVLP